MTAKDARNLRASLIAISDASAGAAEALEMWPDSHVDAVEWLNRLTTALAEFNLDIEEFKDG